MPTEAYEVKFIARIQLETALRLFKEQRDLFSVVTLAGASEEILGKLLCARGIDNSLESLKKAAVAIHEHLFSEPLDPKDIANRANRARNRLKHVSESPDVPVSLLFSVIAKVLPSTSRSNWY